MESKNVLITKPVETIPEQNGMQPHTGSIIFLHGSGDTGAGVKAWVECLESFRFPHLRVLFPTAPFRPYTPNDGLPSNVWFDRLKIHPYASEQLETVDATAKELVNIVNHEVARGVPLHRIAIGGFSMGGAMALHLGYRYLKGVAGVFALSSFLASSSMVYSVLQKNASNKEMPPLFMCHGTDDDLIFESWGQATYDKITSYGVVGEYHTFPKLRHEIDKSELALLSKWISEKIP